MLESIVEVEVFVHNPPSNARKQTIRPFYDSVFLREFGAICILQFSDSNAIFGLQIWQHGAYRIMSEYNIVCDRATFHSSSLCKEDKENDLMLATQPFSSRTLCIINWAEL